MDIRHAGADRVDENLLQVADERRVVDVRIVFVLQGLGALLDVDVEIIVGDHVRELLTRGLDDLGNRLAELVVLDDDGVDDEVGLEAHLIEGLEVRRIGDRNEQPVAALEEGEHAPRDAYAGVHQLLVDVLGVEARQVHHRRAEGARGEHRDLRRAHPLGEDHLFDETDVRGLRLRLHRVRVVLG